MDVDRRRFLLATGGLAAAGWLGAWAEAQALGRAMAAERVAGETEHWTVLTSAEGDTLEAFAGRIIPSDHGVGAREARAARFIDRAIGGLLPELRAPITALAATLDRLAAGEPGGTPFAALAPDVQDRLLRQIEGAEPALFGAGRFGVLLGTFANPSYGGNDGEAGWRLLGFEHAAAWQSPYGWYDTPGNFTP
jgi:hypothetical protein